MSSKPALVRGVWCQTQHSVEASLGLYESWPFASCHPIGSPALPIEFDTSFIISLVLIEIIEKMELNCCQKKNLYDLKKSQVLTECSQCTNHSSQICGQCGDNKLTITSDSTWLLASSTWVQWPILELKSCHLRRIVHTFFRSLVLDHSISFIFSLFQISICFEYLLRLMNKRLIWTHLSQFLYWHQIYYEYHKGSGGHFTAVRSTAL